jgi:hypothetical protein
MKTMNFSRLTLFLGFLFGAGFFFASCSKETLHDSKNNPALLAEEGATTANGASSYDLQNQSTWWAYTDPVGRSVSVSFEVVSGPKTAQVGMNLYQGDYDYLHLIGISTNTAYPGNRVRLTFVAQRARIYTIMLKTWYKSDNGDIITQIFTSRKIIKISLDQLMIVTIPGPVQGTFITGRLLVC